MILNKIFKTKMSDDSFFKIISINKQAVASGYYIGKEHIGLCSLPMNRLEPKVYELIDLYDYWFDAKINRLEHMLNQQIKKLNNDK